MQSFEKSSQISLRATNEICRALDGKDVYRGYEISSDGGTSPIEIINRTEMTTNYSSNYQVWGTHQI